LTKLKSNSNTSPDDNFKIKFNKKGEQVLYIKLNAANKKNDEIISKIR